MYLWTKKSILTKLIFMVLFVFYVLKYDGGNQQYRII